MNEAEPKPKYSRRQALGLLGGLGAGLLTRPFRTFAQEIEEQPVASEEKLEQDQTLVEPRHDYDKIRLYSPKPIPSLTPQELVEYSQAHKRVREWYKKLFIASDQYQNPRLNVLVDQFMADIDKALAQNSSISEFETVMHSYLSKSRMDELGQTIPDQGFTSPFYFSIGPDGSRENGLIYSINVKEPVLPGMDPRFDYNDLEKSKYSILAFAHSMDLMLKYHAKAESLVQSGSYNRDVFIADFKDPKKAIFLFAHSLKDILEIFKEIGPDDIPVFSSLLSQREKLEQTHPQDIEFEWRKFIWTTFINKDVPVDQLR